MSSITHVPYSDEDLRSLYANFDHNRQFFDSTLLKALNLVPFLGYIPNAVIQANITSEFRIRASYVQDVNLHSSLVPRMVELIEIKNHYKITNIIGRLIDIALLVAGVAYGILPVMGLVLAVVAFKSVVIGLDIYNILNNQRLMRNFQENGIPYNRYMDIR